jgi:hypothetical protein
MFYPITSLDVRQRKGELGAFGRIDTAARSLVNLGRPRRISPRDKRILKE